MHVVLIGVAYIKLIIGVCVCGYFGMSDGRLTPTYIHEHKMREQLPGFDLGRLRVLVRMHVCECKLRTR